MQGSRPDRIGDQIRGAITDLLAREVKDPGIGFVTITRVQVTPDLTLARAYYTTMGDDAARQRTARALNRALPFLRRQVGQRLQLRRVPELQFFFDRSIQHQDRVEQILRDLERERAERPAPTEPDDHDER